MLFRINSTVFASCICFLSATISFAQFPQASNKKAYQNPHFSLVSDLLLPRIEYVPYPLSLIKLGYPVDLGSFKLGGLFEVKNEKKFNHRLLPNHLWKGALFGEYIATGNSPIALSLGALHESAHATMGITKEKEDLTDYLFDDMYRKYERNTANTSMYANIPTYQAQWLFLTRMHYLMKSKNTPEVSGQKTGSGWSYQIGTEARLAPKSPYQVRLSCMYDRTFKGKSTAFTNRYEKDATGIVSRTGDFAIIAPVSSWVWATEVNVPIGRYELGSFARYIVGHPGGYWDSRFRTKLWQIGFSAAF